jgi:hypothetical protein
MRGENPVASLTGGHDVCPQIPMKDRLGND